MDNLPRVRKSTWTKCQNTPGVYLVLPGSNSCWMGFIDEDEARTCLLVLPEWKVIVHGRPGVVEDC